MAICRGRVVWAASAALILGAGMAWCEVLGRSAEPLDARPARERECSLGNLVADAARSSLRADAALVQASQLSPVAIPAGDLTRDGLTGALFYPDETTVLVEVSGQQLVAALERGLSMLPKPSTAFLQVSGLTVTFSSEAPAGQRVREVKVGREALAPGKTYRVAMPSSLAKGALGYFRIFGELTVREAGPTLGDALCNHVQTVRVVSPARERRLQDLSQPAG